jgi:hypothetical protein
MSQMEENKLLLILLDLAAFVVLYKSTVIVIERYINILLVMKGAVRKGVNK